jgi:membrane protein DedA with SNARE-associated domain
VLLLGGLSAALWNALLLAVGALLVHNLADMVAFFDRYTRLAWVALALAAAALLARSLLRRRRRTP